MFKRIVLLITVIAAIGWIALGAKAPQENVLQTDQLREASGIALSYRNPGIIFSHNDSGGEAQVYAISTKGKLEAILKLEGASNRDWEDIATYRDASTGKSYIYVGEIGDNAARYKQVAVYRFPEPAIAKGDSLIVIDKVEKIDIVYEDGPRDAEALCIDPRKGDIIIISKREDKVGLYRVEHPYSTNKINTAVKLGTLPLAWVTAADISTNGKKLLLKTYAGVWQFKIKRDKQGAIALAHKPKSRPYHLEPQGEGICWDSKGRGYYTLSEADQDAPQTLYYYK